MSDSDVIKEFLVKLGYKIDEASQKKFTKALNDSEKQALKLAGAVVGTAVVIETFVHKMAQANEALYFMSQRTGAAISNIQGFGYAASQLGGNVEDANSALESMGQFLRYNPAAEGFLNSLKVGTRGANGGLLDTVKIMENLGERLAQLPPFLQKAYGDFFHLSDVELRALTSGDYAKFEEDHNRRLHEAIADTQTLGKENNEYQDTWRLLADDVSIFGQKLESIVVGPATSLLKIVDSIVQGLSHPIDSTWKAFAPTKDFEASGYHGGDFGGLDLARKWLTKDIKLEGGVGGNDRSKVFSQLMGMGWSAENAASLLGNLKGETPNLNPEARNGTHVGIGMWDENRQRDFYMKNGKELSKANLDEQLIFMNYELTEGKYKRIGDQLRGLGVADGAQLLNQKYEYSDNDPIKRYNNGVLRGEYAESIYRAAQQSSPVNISNNNNFTITSPDPQAAGAAVYQKINQINKDSVRNAASPIN